MEQTFMKEKKILPLVLSMSLPMVISMAVNALYNIIDSYFVAKVSENAMTALAIVFPVQNLINAVAIGFGIGINAGISFFLGANQEEKADQTATLGTLFAFLQGSILALISILAMPLFLNRFSSDQEMAGLALTYSYRAFAFAPIIAVGLSFEKIFQAMGKMKVTMFCMMCGCITNIILDPLMIFGIGIFPEMGIAGAAYATGIGQCVTLAAYLLFYRYGQNPVVLRRKYMRPDAEILKKIYPVGISAALNLALPSFLISYFKLQSSPRASFISYHCSPPQEDLAMPRLQKPIFSYMPIFSSWHVNTRLRRPHSRSLFAYRETISRASPCPR